ncbi:MAG: hypothetical protein BGO49_12830 [Planctomycetales bacterium 71-10]|nr:MAG: hypothetical protein BGO49_12830 [Planctomycetales bacterium 71-10]
MSGPQPSSSNGRGSRWLHALAIPALAASALTFVASGCGDSSPPPVSPVVAADSEEARKALAEDQAERAALKQKEAKVAARKKKLVLPVEPE